MENNALQPGAELQNGKYRIVSMLGQGGFGITYKAEQVLLHREVAVKEFFMKDCCERDLSTSHVSVGTGSQRELVRKFRDKFLREAQMIAGLDNPHIVKIHDVFEENGTAYSVMENLPGGSLADKVKKDGGLSEAQAEKYIRQVADALAYIHERNTVHLDVKPSNILLNTKGEAVLIDFGISKHYDKAGEQTSSTPVGISKGYAPMEQGRDGDVSQFGPSTDIYALGATLYHLVSGQVPPEASIVVEEGLDRPQGISDKIWNVIERSMQPKRKDRPQSIAEFMQLFDVAPVQKKDDADETVVITKIDTHVEAEKKHSKTLLWIAIGAIAVAVIVLAIVFGKKRPVEDVHPEPVKETVETVVTPAEPVKQPAIVITVTGIKLSKSSLELEEGQSATLKATVSPADATNKYVTWKSYDEQIATVSTAGKITAKKAGTATIVARCGELEASCKVTVKEKPAPVQQQPVQQTAQQTQTSNSSPTGYDNGHEWVNLGLPSGTKWATCNLGAFTPTGNGNYYAWGEISTKSVYSWENYRFRTGGDSYENVGFSKYNTDESNGPVDNKKQLDLSDDAARANWGGKWRIPTKAQWEELKSKCTWSWTEKGYKVTGPNGKSITLPVAGSRNGSSLHRVGTYGNYWSSSLSTDYPYNAWRMNISYMNFDIYDTSRFIGFSIRPVTQ